ncbi:phosphoribosyltransferase [Methylohalobius crimeensis]|uniref:phosphoribosyltransferase n=1 Tax=Methylohalobius crimeensis TaxID=244365 RepID=UPI0003B4B7DD|nr:phosphoribosyltransferase [Methylohalobius crimeensis]
MFFTNREEAGRLLAARLEKFRDRNPVILALPRGGLPVGYEIATTLDAPLDIILVRKIGAPGSPELAAGAVVDGDHPELILNQEVISILNIPDDFLEDRKKQQLIEIERRRELYLAGRPPISVEDRTAIVVDDGVATGSTVRAAVHALKRRKPKQVVIAVPVAPPETARQLAQEADEVICLDTPDPFYAIGVFYQDFAQLTDEDVIHILKMAEEKQQG